MKQIAWASFDSYASSILAVLSIAIISRILSPEEIGIFSTASVFVGIATVLRDFGVSNYLIQARICDQRSINAASLLAQIFALTAAVALCALAYPLSLFYSEPRLIPALFGLAFNLLLIPRISISLALLRREMRFDSLVSVTFFMTLSLNIGGIAFTLLGASYMSMIYGAILSNMVGLYLSTRKNLQISYTFDKSIFKDILSFGVMNTVTNLLRDARSHLNEIVLAKTQGMAIVAYQSKAFSLMSMFWGSVMPGVYSFTLPHFAKEIREGSDIRAKFLVATGKTMGVALPALAFLAIEGDVLILLLNGSQWGISAEIGRIVPAIYLIGFPPIALVGTLLVAGGYMKDLALIQLCTLPPKLAVLFAVMYEPLGIFIAWNVAADMLVELVLYAYYLKRHFEIGILELYGASLSSYILTVSFSVLIFLSRLLCEEVTENLLLRVAAQGLFGFFVWVTLIRVFSNPLQEDIAHLFVAIRSKICSKKSI